MTTPNNHEHKGKLQWACRRGMLELDMLLQPFAEHVYPTLSADEQTNFRALLQCHDNDLFQWLVANNNVTVTRFIPTVQAVRAFADAHL